jgi:hypothetical protein
MQTIQLNDKFISLDDIQNCVNAFEKILSGEETEKTIVINANNRIEGVDLVLISYFILFKKQITELQIILNLPHNPIEPENTQVEYQLKQFGTYAYIMTGMEVFQIVFGIGDSKRQINFDLNKKSSYPDTWFVFSDDYFPILFITNDNKFFDFILNDSITLLSEKFNLNIDKLEKGITWNKNSAEIKQSYHTFLRQSSTPGNREKSLFNLSRMAFVNSLDEAKIANLFFEEEYNPSDYNAKNRIQAGNLQNEVAFAYYKLIKPVFEELKNCSIAHQFFFSTILATEMLKDRESGKNVLNDATKASFVNKINNLWGFTKDLVAGIKELSKNIREHSNPPFGAISVRLFGMKKWIQTKTLSADENNVYYKYNQHLLNNDFNEESSVIDVNVIDMGNSGVIPTLIKNTESVFSKVSGKNLEIEKLIKEDIENLASKKIGFHNLLNTLTQQLNQQSKRSIAHFGLLTLSKLVAHNNGLIIASSQNNSLARESLCIPGFVQNYFHPIKTGTNYNIVLPINPIQSYTTHLPHKINLPSETSAKDIKGVEELFQYELVNLVDQKNDYTLNSGSKYLIEINFQETVLNNRDDEDIFWDRIANDIGSIKINTDIKFAFCLNLLKVTINESQLFRLLGKCELNFPNIPIIIFNIENEFYQKLIKINGEFHSQNSSLAYWNENISTLVYSYQKIKGKQFNYSDVLWGKTRKDFVYLNWLVSFSALNSTSILHKDSIKKAISVNQSVNPNTDLFFLTNNNLLPFELILMGSDNITLFEENTLVLLKNELK